MTIYCPKCGEKLGEESQSSCSKCEIDLSEVGSLLKSRSSVTLPGLRGRSLSFKRRDARMILGLWWSTGWMAPALFAVLGFDSMVPVAGVVWIGGGITLSILKSYIFSGETNFKVIASKDPRAELPAKNAGAPPPKGDWRNVDYDSD
ncbi:MAG: hypothetical protein ACKN97_02345 [Acidobacteriota bacterium]